MPIFEHVFNISTVFMPGGGRFDCFERIVPTNVPFLSFFFRKSEHNASKDIAPCVENAFAMPLPFGYFVTRRLRRHSVIVVDDDDVIIALF